MKCDCLKGNSDNNKLSAQRDSRFFSFVRISFVPHGPPLFLRLLASASVACCTEMLMFPKCSLLLRAKKEQNFKIGWTVPLTASSFPSGNSLSRCYQMKGIKQKASLTSLWEVTAAFPHFARWTKMHTEEAALTVFTWGRGKKRKKGKSAHVCSFFCCFIASSGPLWSSDSWGSLREAVKRCEGSGRARVSSSGPLFVCQEFSEKDTSTSGDHRA